MSRFIVVPSTLTTQLSRLRSRSLSKAICESLGERAGAQRIRNIRGAWRRERRHGRGSRAIGSGGAAELASAKAMGEMAQALANDGADRAAGPRRAEQGPPTKAAPAATRAGGDPRSPKRATRAAPRRAARKPSKPKK